MHVHSTYNKLRPFQNIGEQNKSVCLETINKSVSDVKPSHTEGNSTNRTTQQLYTIPREIQPFNHIPILSLFLCTFTSYFLPCGACYLVIRSWRSQIGSVAKLHSRDKVASYSSHTHSKRNHPYRDYALHYSGIV